MTLDELGAALDELQNERRNAEKKLRATRGRKQAIEQLEADKEALLAHYARVAPEALESLTPEERHGLYKMLRLQVSVRPDTSLEVSGVFGDALNFSAEEIVPR